MPSLAERAPAFEPLRLSRELTANEPVCPDCGIRVSVRHCAVCGACLGHYSTGGKYSSARYCKDACRQKAYRDRVRAQKRLPTVVQTVTRLEVGAM